MLWTGGLGFQKYLRKLYQTFPILENIGLNYENYDHYDSDRNRLRYAKIRDTDSALWVPLLEKAYMKLQGNYLNADGGNPQIALRALTGAPNFVYIN